MRLNGEPFLGDAHVKTLIARWSGYFSVTVLKPFQPAWARRCYRVEQPLTCCAAEHAGSWGWRRKKHACWGLLSQIRCRDSAPQLPGNTLLPYPETSERCKSSSWVIDTGWLSRVIMDGQERYNLGRHSLGCKYQNQCPKVRGRYSWEGRQHVFSEDWNYLAECILRENTMWGLVKTAIGSLFSYPIFYQESRARRFGHASFCGNQDFSLPSALANGNTDTVSSGTESLIGNESAYRKVPGDLNHPPP